MAHNRQPALEQRRLRVPFHNRPVTVRVAQPHGQTVPHQVVTRNLSSFGLSFIHGRFIYPDTQVSVELPRRTEGQVQVDGYVARCRHVGGIVHELSIVFDRAIQLEDHVELNGEHVAQAARERLQSSADGEPGSGSEAATVILSPEPTDRALYGMWLAQLGLAAREAGDGAEAQELVLAYATDLIVFDADPDPNAAATQLTRLRDAGQYQGRVLALTGDEAPATGDLLIAAGATAVVTKPLEAARLQDAVSRLLADEHAPSGMIYSRYHDDAAMGPVVAQFVAALPNRIAALQQALEARQVELLRRLCRQLKGMGGTYGFDRITAAAQEVIDRLDPESDAMPAGSDDDIHPTVITLIEVLRRARA